MSQENVELVRSLFEAFNRREYASAVETCAGPRDLVLNAACSPGRSDHYDAIAVEWLRRWRPETTAVALPQCRCPAGRCETCN